MPSFTRRAPLTQAAPPPGTTPSSSTNIPLLPTGIPSLDDLFAGGIPLGGAWMILAPDSHSAWSRLVARYWISQGLVTGQGSLVVGEIDGCEDLVRGCMWVDERELIVDDTSSSVNGSTGSGNGSSGTTAAKRRGSESEGEGEESKLGDDVGEGKGGRKIAWRYESMAKFKTTIGSSNNLSLTKTIPAALLSEMEKAGQQTYLALTNDEEIPGPSSKPSWTVLSSVLSRIQIKLDKLDRSSALRITVNDLGSLDWGDLSSSEIHRFLHALRGLLRSKTASALITLPAELAKNPPKDWTGGREAWVKSLAWAVDACVELRGFGDSPALAPLYHPLHGLLTLHSFPTTSSLLPPTIRHSTLLGVSQSAGSGTSGGGSGAGENNLGFRCGRKRFVVETVHLGIEGGTGERRTAPVEDVKGVIQTHSQSQSHSHGHTQAQQQGGTNAVEAEGVEKAEKAVPSEEVPAKEKKPRRARVRFGGDDEVMEVNTGPPRDDHSGHNHDHNHDHAHAPANDTKPIIRHDKPELYEF